jgi:tetratricopeptide (TPR) repeat protein
MLARVFSALLFTTIFLPASRAIADDDKPSPELLACISPSERPSARAESCKTLIKSPSASEKEKSAAMNGLGTLYMQAHDYKTAITVFTLQLDTLPKDFRTYINRGHAYLWSGQSELAFADFGSAIALHPGFSYFVRAQAYYNAGQYDRALSDCNAELQVNPDNKAAKALLQINAHISH